jgi:alkylation response protein AidB-like acyl-CoA dehydrogenase
MPHLRRLEDHPWLNDLPPEVWQFIKDKGFLGMIIPHQYGGLGFSASRAFAGNTKLATATPRRAFR